MNVSFSAMLYSFVDHGKTLWFEWLKDRGGFEMIGNTENYRKNHCWN